MGTLPGYPKAMSWLRYMMSCLAGAVIVALVLGNVAMAANAVGHNAHCVDAIDDTVGETASYETHDHAHDHSNDQAALMDLHAASDHDHETCMMHACPALSPEPVNLTRLSGVFLARLIWPDRALLAPVRAEGLKRPPKA